MPAGMHGERRLVSAEDAAFAAMTGTALAHTDLNRFNVLVDDEVRFVDWAWAAAAAPWLDAALTVPRLLAAGHSVIAAEAWADTVPAYVDTKPDALASFAVANLGRVIWLRHAGRAVSEQQIHQARMWANHRLELAGEPPL